MNRLKELREERNLTVRKVDELTGINYMTLNNYENEVRDMSTKVIKQLASFYEVSIDYLLNNSDYFLYVNYKNIEKKYIIQKNMYEHFLKNGLIYFSNNKRYVNLNKLLELDEDQDINVLIQNIYNLLRKTQKKPLKSNLIEINELLIDKISDDISKQKKHL